MNANSYNAITDLQSSAIRAAAERVGCPEADMAGFFLEGGDWDAVSEAELEEELVEAWADSLANRY